MALLFMTPWVYPYLVEYLGDPPRAMAFAPGTWRRSIVGSGIDGIVTHPDSRVFSTWHDRCFVLGVQKGENEKMVLDQLLGPYQGQGREQTDSYQELAFPGSIGSHRDQILILDIWDALRDGVSNFNFLKEEIR